MDIDKKFYYGPDLLMILPKGVVSKKAMVDDMMCLNMWSCSETEALKVPMVIKMMPETRATV